MVYCFSPKRGFWKQNSLFYFYDVFMTYNMQGRKVSTLIDDNMEAGYHSVTWNGNNYASGMYFVKINAGNYISTQKLMLVK